MFCPYCGNKREASFRFCAACGKLLPVVEIEESLPEPELTEAVPTPEDALPDLPAVQETASEIVPEPVQVDVNLPEPEIIMPEAVTPQVPQRKGRLWPPLVICAVMITVGLLSFFFLSSRPQDPTMPWFHVEDGVLSFDASRYTGPEELTIPEQVGGYTVTVIGDGCFAYCEDLTTVYIPETVTRIEDNAFFGCTSIRGILIPESCEYIGSAAFQTCRSLEAICIPYTVKEMGSSVFTNCDSLRYIIYPGPHAAWVELYPDLLPPDTQVHTADGVFAQRP